MNQQLDLFATSRRRPLGTDPVIDWDSVTGFDLSADVALARRWVREVNEPLARRIDKMRRQRRRLPLVNP
jgi:hypothetical protein